MPAHRTTLDDEGVLRAFAADGLHGVGVDALARAAGVAKPTLYVHGGGGKAELFARTVETEVERVLDAVLGAHAAAGPGLEAAIEAIGGALDAHARERPDGFRLLHRTARHRGSSVAGRVDGAVDRVPAAVGAVLVRELRREGRPLAPAVVRAVAAALVAAQVSLAESAAGGSPPGPGAAGGSRALAAALRAAGG